MLIKAIQSGIRIDEFWQMSWRDFILYSIAFDRKELAHWLKVRQICFTVVRMNGDPKKVPATPMAYWPMPGDVLPKPMGKEEIQAAIHKYSKSTSQLTGKA